MWSLGLEKLWTSGNWLSNGVLCTVHVQPCRLAMGVFGFALPIEIRFDMGKGFCVGFGKVFEFD